MYIISSEWYNSFLEIYYDKCNELPDNKRNKMDPKYDHKTLFLERYDYDDWFENKESTDKEELNDKEESVDFSDMPPLECDRIKEGKRLKF